MRSPRGNADSGHEGTSGRLAAAAVKPVPAHGLTSEGIDAIKGVAIVAVVLGHNWLLTERYPAVWHVIYAFNIFPFLFLPFLFPSRALTGPFVVDRVVRYLVPWSLVYLLCGGLFFLQSDDLTWRAWLGDLAIGLLIGTAPLVKAASGFQLFWFLPCLLTVVLLRAAMARWPTTGSWLVMSGGLILLALVGRMPQQPLAYVPATAHVAMMMVPVGASLAWIWRNLHSRVGRGATAVVFGSLWLGLSIWMYMSPLNAEHSTLTIFSPKAFAIRLGTMMSSFLFLCAVADRLGRASILVALGRHSLMIYLTSSLWFQAWLRLEGRVSWPDWWQEAWAARIAVSLGVSLGAAFALSWAVTAFPPLRRWVMPRSWAEWPPTARLSRRILCEFCS